MRRLTSRLWTDFLSCELSPDLSILLIPLMHHVTRMMVHTGTHPKHAVLVDTVFLLCRDPKNSAYMLR